MRQEEDQSQVSKAMSWSTSSEFFRKTQHGSAKLVVFKMLSIALMSLATLPAAADGGAKQGPSAADRAKMDAALQAACGGDFSTFCPTASDPRAKFDCLRANESNLTSTCSALVAEIKAHRPPGPPPGSSSESSSNSSSTAPSVATSN